MTKFPEMASWLTVKVNTDSARRYEHALGRENVTGCAKSMARLKALVSDAHEDARKRLRALVGPTHDPLGAGLTKDPADGYPERLHIQTLKGYFGEILAGIVAENFNPFGMKDWEVPAYLFRFHHVAFEQLEMMGQTGAPAGLVPGRTGDDLPRVPARKGWHHCGYSLLRGKMYS